MLLIDLLDGTKAFTMQNEITGGYIATIDKTTSETVHEHYKGENQIARIKTALQEEFSSEKIEFENVNQDDGNGITFDIKLDDEGFQSIQLLTAYIY